MIHTVSRDWSRRYARMYASRWGHGDPTLGVCFVLMKEGEGKKKGEGKKGEEKGKITATKFRHKRAA